MRNLSALLAALISGTAHAAEPAVRVSQEQTVPVQPVPIEELVVTATRLPTPVPEIPASVIVIDRAAIEAGGYNTLVDALATVPGLHVSPSGGPGGQASVFMRGTNSNHVLVLRDGMPINDASDASGAFNFGVDTLYDVERIEIVRGPMAALYGSGAIGGVINLISRRGTQPGIHWLGDVAGGYPAQIRGAVGATGVEGRFDFAITAESQSQLGYDSTPQRMSIYTGRPQGFRDRIGTLNLGFTPIDGTRLSLFLRARSALFGFNTLGSPTFDTANSSGRADSLLGRIGVTSKLFDGAYETSLFLGRLQEDRHYTEYLDPGDPNQAAIDSRYHSYRTDLQWNNTVHISDFVPVLASVPTVVTFGFQHTGDTVKLRVNDSFGGFPFAQSAAASMKDDALYMGLRVIPWEWLILNAQIRQDWVGSDAPTTWRLGAVLEVTEIATHLKVAYGTAFRAPSLFDRFGIDSFGYVGNPALIPEWAEGWEAGFTTDLALAGRADFASFGATYFNQSVRNLIVAVFSPVDTAINTGTARVQGVETEITLRPVPWLILRASYTFTDTVAAGQPPSIGSTLLRRPAYAAAASMTVEPLPGLRIVPELTFGGARRDFLYDNAGFGAGYGTGQHGLIANLAVSYDVKPGAAVYLIGRNILGSRFEPVNGYQTPGPTVLIGMRVGL